MKVSPAMTKPPAARAPATSRTAPLLAGSFTVGATCGWTATNPARSPPRIPTSTTAPQLPDGSRKLSRPISATSAPRIRYRRSPAPSICMFIVPLLRHRGRRARSWGPNGSQRRRASQRCTTPYRRGCAARSGRRRGRRILEEVAAADVVRGEPGQLVHDRAPAPVRLEVARAGARSEEHTSELQSRENLVCRLLLEKKKKK